MNNKPFTPNFKKGIEGDAPLQLRDSGAENDRARELASLQKAGKIKDLHEQTVVELEPGITYRTDFDYIAKGRRAYENVTGITSERFRMIMKLWRLHGPGPLLLVKRKSRNRAFQVTRIISGGKTP